MKKLLIFVLTIGILLVGFSVTAFASETEPPFDDMVVLGEYDSVNGGSVVDSVPKKGALGTGSLGVPMKLSVWQNTSATVVDFSAVDRSNFALEMWLYVGLPTVSENAAMNFRFQDAASDFSSTRFYEYWLTDGSEFELNKWNKIRIKYPQGGSIGSDTANCDTFSLCIYNNMFKQFYINNAKIVYDNELTKCFNVLGNDDLISLNANVNVINFEKNEGGDTFQLTPSVVGDDMFVPEFSFSSADSLIATVDDTGLVTKKEIGSTNITITTVYKEFSYQYNVKVYVRDSANKLPITVVENNQSSKNAVCVDKAPFSAKEKQSLSIKCSGAWQNNLSRNIDLHYANRKNFVLSLWIYADNVLQDKGAFNFLLSKSSANIPDFSKNDHFEAWVENAASKLTLGKWNKVLINYNCVGGVVNAPADVDFYSLNVFQNAFSTFYIHDVQIVDEPASSLFQVTDLEESIDFHLSTDNVTVTLGGEKQIYSYVSGSLIEAPSVIWSTSNAKIAKVEKNGVVKGLSKGVTTITAKIVIDNVTLEKKCNVQVNDIVEGITISDKSLNQKLSDSQARLSCKLITQSPNNRSVVWTTSDSSIATVDQNGVVTFVSGGKVTIKVALAENMNISDECVINIEETRSGMSGCNSSVASFSYFGAIVGICVLLCLIIAMRRKKYEN